MSAGTSAAQQSQRLSALARSYLLEAERAQSESGRYAAAAVAERRLARRLSPLTAKGYYLLADRVWPGSKNAQLDLIVVGPSGVWIVDSKHWSNFNVAAGSMFRDQADVTDEVLRLADVAYDAEEAFAQVGLAPGEVRPLLVMAGHRGRLGEVGTVEVVGEADVQKHLASRGHRLTTTQVERVLAVAMKYFPAYLGPQKTVVDLTIAEPVLDGLPLAMPSADGPHHVRKPGIVDAVQAPPLNDALLSEREVMEALSAAELAAPVEDWMTFLHPSQAALVRRTFNGPARIRGGAGTGKTVVGLHRAAYLARVHPHGRILFTTFVRTLPAVMSNLLKRLAPEAAERVDFVHVHGLASQVLKDRGIRFTIDSRRCTQILDQAWHALPTELRARLARQRKLEYWKEEVDSVIKGRGFTSFDQYAECARPGRTLRLTLEDRKAVWALYKGYDELLRAAGLCDFQDLVLLAEASLERTGLPQYSAVIVDEAQDLSLAMIRMLHSLVGDGPDAFTLIGDGQQNIYPGGYVLSEAGISLAGRGVVLGQNYRNTAQIDAFARSLIEGSTFTDIDDDGPPAATEGRSSNRKHDDGATATAQGAPLRDGPAPEIAQFASRAVHDAALIARIKREGETALGDIAILCETNGEVAAIEKQLGSAGIPSMNLLDYVGAPSNSVKVGTVKRAKGLEFKLVMIPWSVRTHGEQDEEHAARAVRERYVAATRARDALWIGNIAI